MAVRLRFRRLTGLVAAGLLSLVAGCAEAPHQVVTPTLAPAPAAFQVAASRNTPDSLLFTRALGYYLNAERDAARLNTLLVEPLIVPAAESYSRMMAALDQDGLYVMNAAKTGYEPSPGARIDRSVRFVGYNDVAFAMPLRDGACTAGTMPTYADLARQASATMMGSWRQGNALAHFTDRFGAGIAFDTREGCDVALVSLMLIGGTPKPPRKIGRFEAWADASFD